MSRVKNPQDKKRLRLDRDRRNVFRENDNASRKNIPRSKQLSQMRIRRAATQALARLRGEHDDSAEMEADALVKLQTIVLRRIGFRKMPDQPLRKVLAENGRARFYRAICNALKAAKIQPGLSNGVRIEIEDDDSRFTSVRLRDVVRACHAIRGALERNSPHHYEIHQTHAIRRRRDGLGRPGI
jgi:hypothetical protein